MENIKEMKLREAREREAAYAEIAQKLGDDVAESLREYFSIVDERFYLWLADLYDPGKYGEDGNPLGGGFYYTPSARDTVGYNIDIESTQQALDFLTTAGMVRGKLRDELPKKMIKEMVAFAYSLQSSEDGYFYHPQWGTNINSNRLSRDLIWATKLLSTFGYKPYWNTPNGDKGMYGEPGMTKGSEGERNASANGTVTNLDKWPDRLRTLENWENYLKGFEADMKSNSYGIGHTVAEQRTQIKARDEEARTNGEKTGYAAITERYFNLWQNPENGLWEKNVTYSSINGLMKIMALYQELGLHFNYAEKAVNAAIEIVALEGPDEYGVEARASTYVYNPWCAISRIFDCLNKQGESELVTKLRAKLYSRAAELIRISRKKTIKFKKDDGSYGFTFDYSHSHQQGVPAAVPQTVEGDIDGAICALFGVTWNMMRALDLSGKITLFAPSDLQIFLERIAERTHIEKPIAENK